MVKNKRVYWLKLPKDFFQSKEIKKLQRRAGGDTFVKIYLKLLLLSLGDEGYILFEQIEDTLAEQLAIEIDEDINDIEALLLYLNHNKLISTNDNGIFMDQIPEMIGSETIDAERKRRERNSGMISKLGHCPEKLGHRPDVSNNVPNKEKEEEKEEEKDKKIDIEKEQTNQSINQFIKLVSEITETNLYQVQQVINLATLRDYDINLLIIKIKESDFLSGKLETKPIIRNFTQKIMLDKIVIDFYKNKKTKIKETIYNEKKDEYDIELDKILEGVK